MNLLQSSKEVFARNPAAGTDDVDSPVVARYLLFNRGDPDTGENLMTSGRQLYVRGTFWSEMK